ncbi:MAG: hypothetical protein KF910_14215 [Brevundimonas sp.]|uniref:hypothetical protein n=1 Tax=Brevundimonas sp. TaxID=1871086 RepID=UPI0025BB8FF4|nr:hypothetical protein [Brevundimonas sp.]MBX3478756.1 hypothetical protein [Brevundimonas sp.]
MRALPLIAVGVIALSACGQREETSAPAALAPVADAAPAPLVAAPASAEEACRRAVLIQYGQDGQAVAYDPATGQVSWAAPVDGGRLSFACAVRGAEVVLSRDDQTQTVTLPTSAAAPAVAQEAR